MPAHISPTAHTLVLPLSPLPSQAKEALPVMPVRLLDTKSGTWSAVECSAAEGEELPKPRGGHSVRGGGRRRQVAMAAAGLVAGEVQQCSAIHAAFNLRLPVCLLTDSLPA
jgi:hypothetical protein